MMDTTQAPNASGATEEDAIAVSRILGNASEVVTIWCGEYLDGRLVLGMEPGKLIPIAFHFKSRDVGFEGLFVPKPGVSETLSELVDEILKDVVDIHMIQVNRSKNEFLQGGGKLS